jgi:2-keto-4-pentenoate hydratase
MNTNKDNLIQTASDALFRAYQEHSVCEPIRNLIGDTDLQKAYEIQSSLNTSMAKLNNGNAVIGRKIGVTAFAGQKSFGISEPVFGTLFQNMELDNNVEVGFEEFYSPKVEVEIAFIMKKSITSPVSTAQLVQAIDYVAPAIEIVGSRMNWDVKITDMVADNMGASHFVLGHNFKRLDKVDLINCQMQLCNKKEKIAEGIGSICLGSPLNSLHWLANRLAIIGNPLSAGETIISGSLAPMLPIQAGSHLEAHIEGLGEVKISLSKE